MGRTRRNISLSLGLFLFLDVIEISLGSCLIPDPAPNTIMQPPLNEINDISLGTYISWSCELGYVMTGVADTVVWVCSTDGQWLGISLNCSASSCPSPPIPAFASATSDGVAMVNESITYKCVPDYTLMFGSTDNRCNAEGIWENTLPVCQRHCEIDDKCQRYSNQTCFRRRDKKKWEAAARLCESEGEMLATVKDEATQTFLSDVLDNIAGQSVWIGAREDLDWKWRNSNEYIRTLFWQEAFPDPSRQAKSCIEVAYDTDRYTWKASACYNMNGIICQYASPCRADEATARVDYRGNCFHFLDEQMTWADGVGYCKQLMGAGGYLAEIHDESTNDLLNRKMHELKANLGDQFSWWIGGYDFDDESEKSWFWIDNTRVDYQSWKPLADLSKVCVEMEKSETYSWNDENCNQRRRTLCQIGIAACGDPGEPLHGRRTPDDRTTFAVGATMEFECYGGYDLVGPKITNCRTDGTWDSVKPSCQVVHCPEDVPSVPNGANVTILSNAFRGVAVYTCREGFLPTNSPTSVCLQNATWSSLEFTCEAIPRCYREPCLNGGTCKDKEGGAFDCLCAPGFQGPACEIEMEPLITVASTLSPDEPTGGVITTKSEPGPSEPRVAAIASSVVVLLVIAVAMALVIILLMRRKRMRSERQKNNFQQSEMHHYETAMNNYASKGQAIAPSGGPKKGGVNGGLHAGKPGAKAPSALHTVPQKDTDLSDYVYYQYGADTGEEDVEKKEPIPRNGTNHRGNVPDVIQGVPTAQGKGRSEEVGRVSKMNDVDDDDDNDDAYQEMEDEMVANELYHALPDDSTGRVVDQGGRLNQCGKSDEGNIQDLRSPPSSVPSAYQTYDNEPGDNPSVYQTLRFGESAHSDGPNPVKRRQQSGAEANANTQHVYELEGAVEDAIEDDYVNTDYHAEPEAMVANDLYHSVDNI